MNCQDVRERLSMWVDREDSGLGPEDRRLIAEHLDTCSGCRDALKELEGTVALLRALPAIEKPWTVQARAMALGRTHAEKMESDSVMVASRMRAAAALSLPAATAVSERPLSMHREPRRWKTRVWLGVVVAAAAILALLAYGLLR